MRTGTKKSAFVFVMLLLVSVSIAVRSLGESTVGTGSIVGMVTDSSNAFIGGAKITITNVATGQVIELTTNSSRTFDSGALVPGKYRTFVSARGFSSAQSVSTVMVGNTATINVKLQIGSEKEVRVGIATGVYSLGAPRQLDFGLRFTF